MLLLITSFMAGVLTVLAPCVLPILPIIVGGSIRTQSKRPAFILIGSLAISIIIFTLLLKGTTYFLRVPTQFWSSISGIILIVFGIITIFPHMWEKASESINTKTRITLQAASAKTGFIREIAMGAALGPVFASCSPTYSLIIATVLPTSFLKGALYTGVYALGLATILLSIALLGRRITVHLRGIANPDGWFKKILGIIFVIVGLSILFGWDKAIETYIIEHGYLGITSFEQDLVKQLR